jgi:hypothetical protein
MRKHIKMLFVLLSIFIFSGCSFSSTNTSGSAVTAPEKSYVVSKSVWKSGDGGISWEAKDKSLGKPRVKDLDVLSIATGNASEIIGEGFVDALARASGGTEASDAAIFLETLAGGFNKVTMAAGTAVGAIPSLIRNVKNLGKNIFQGFVGKQFGVSLAAPEKKAVAKENLTEKKQQELLAKFEKESLRRERERLALKNKQVAADKLKAAIAKGELALGKGAEIFDLEKIQLQAAEINQAELLGKATNAAQLLQIGNDTARLNVKKSIAALEDAIAAKDEAAIIAASKKLEKDVKSLDALTGQNTQLATLKSILDSLDPKKLIDIDNLKEAIDLLNRPPLSVSPNSPMGNAPVMPSSLNPIAGAGGVRPSRGFTNEELQYFEDINEYQFAGSLSGLTPTPSSNSVNITVNTGVGDPNAIAEAIDDVLRQARSRGTLVALP